MVRNCYVCQVVSRSNSAVLPPNSHLPRFVETVAYLTVGRGFVNRMARRTGGAFTMHLPGFGPAVVVSDPALAKQVFQYSRDLLGGVEPNIGVIIGPGSTFALQGDDHRRRRKVLVPPFHGKRMRVYGDLIRQETLDATAEWRDGEEFPVLPSMMKIGLNTILRAVFGADGDDLETLREIVPGTVTQGTKLAMMPWLRHKYTRWSPWPRYLARRQQLFAVLDSMIVRAQQDPSLDSREDVLALLVKATHDDGSNLSRQDIAEELYTLLGAGHETTATTVAWTLERLRRHPAALARLVDEIDAGGSEYLQATIAEVLRVRPPIGSVARHVVAPSIRLGPWIIPQGYTVVVSVEGSHLNETEFEDPDAFRPERFLGTPPNPYAWVPFGGGLRRCPGAAFAQFEVAAVLRTLLGEFSLMPTTAPAERWHYRGVAYAPASGGRIVVHRRHRVRQDRRTAESLTAGGAAADES